MPSMTAAAAPICSLLLSLMNKILRCLNFSLFYLFLTQGVHFTLFQLRTISSDLELLILIPTSSHLVANCSSASTRPPPDETKKTISLVKSRNKILRMLKWKISTTWLHLEILSTKIMNRICDKGQSWLSPTPTGNESNFYVDQAPAIVGAHNI